MQRFPKICCRLALFVSCSLWFVRMCCGNSVDVSAYSGYLSPRSAIGDTITVSYTDSGGNRITGQATYYATEHIVLSQYPVNTLWNTYFSGHPSQDCYALYAPSGVSMAQDVTIRVAAPYTVSSYTDLIGFVGCVSIYSVSSQAYDPPYVVVRYENGTTETIESPAYDNEFPRIGSGDRPNILPAVFHLTSEENTSVSFIEYHFRGCAAQNSTIYIGMGYPFYQNLGTDTAVINTDIIPAQTSTTAVVTDSEDIRITVNVNVDVDMQGVENRLDSVAEGVGNIENALVGGTTADMYLQADDLQSYTLTIGTEYIDEALSVMDDTPDVVAAAGFWWHLGHEVLHLDSPFFALVPFCIMLCLARFVLWKG